MIFFVYEFDFGVRQKKEDNILRIVMTRAACNFAVAARNSSKKPVGFYAVGVIMFYILPGR